MTKDEIKKALDDAGIEYDARLGKAKLAELMPATPEPAGTVEVIVLHPTGIQLDSSKEDMADRGYRALRWRGMISQEEYNLVTSRDEAAGRTPRLMKI